MVAVITGDIINSRKGTSSEWLTELKSVLNQFGKEPKQWEIYRGDSFQLEVLPENALKAAILIKAGIKQNRNIDVRMAIGIGEKSFEAEKLTESNGTAFILSGECFEQLKKQTLAIKSTWPSFDEEMNQLLELSLLTMNHWPQTTSMVVKFAMENPKLNQEQLAKKLSKSQSSISEALKRAGYEEIMKVEKKFKSKIKNI